MAAHFLTVELVGMHLREQQSSSLAHTSPSRRVQAFPSVLVHVRFAMQRATPSGPVVQLDEQQSDPVEQSSPLARQPETAAQTRAPLRVSHTCPQQSVSAAQVSPAGWHAGAAAHAPAVHAPLQQSLPRRQLVPETAHALPPSLATSATAPSTGEPPSGPSRMVSDVASQPASASAMIPSVRT